MKTIAIVDDNSDNVWLLEALLQDDYKVQSFYSGKNALESFKKFPPDLVLLDISLPEMDGLTVLKLIRQDVQLKTLPIIALTAHAMKGDEEKYIQAGFDGYLAKPIVDETSLFSAISNLLQKRTENAHG